MRVNRETQCIERSLNCLLQGDLQGFKEQLTSDLYWPYILGELERLHVSGLFYTGLKRAGWVYQDAVKVHLDQPIRSIAVVCPVPKAAVEVLRIRAADIEIRNQVWMSQIGPVLSIINDAGVIPMLVGGSDLAYRVYTDDACRDQEEIEFFVPRAQASRIHDLLLSTGYLCASLGLEGIVPSSHKSFKKRVLLDGKGEGSMVYEHNKQDLPPVRMHYRLWNNTSKPPTVQDRLEKHALNMSSTIHVGDAIVFAMSAEHMIAYYAARAYYQSYSNIRDYFDTAAILVESFYSSQAALVHWSQLRSIVNSLDLNLPLYYFLEILNESIELPQRELFAGQVGRIDLLTLQSLKHRRFHGRPNWMLDLRKARGLRGKAGAIFKHMLVATRAS